MLRAVPSCLGAYGVREISQRSGCKKLALKPRWEFLKPTQGDRKRRSGMQREHYEQKQELQKFGRLRKWAAV